MKKNKKPKYKLKIIRWKNNILFTEEFFLFNFDECIERSKKYKGHIKIYNDSNEIIFSHQSHHHHIDETYA